MEMSCASGRTEVARMGLGRSACLLSMGEDSSDCFLCGRHCPLLLPVRK